MNKVSLTAAEPDTAPLSWPQRIWYRLDAGDLVGAFGCSFVMPCALRITGDVDLPALNGALDDVVERHEILRTVIVRDTEVPYQQVHPPRPVPLEVRDLRKESAQPHDVVAEQLFIETKRSPMDVRQLCLLRAVLGRLDQRDWLLVLLVHHSASDRWSSRLIIRDLAQFYQARVGGYAAALPPARQYREFVEWQLARLATPAADADLDYWRGKLSGARIFALPTDRPVPDQHTQPYSAYVYPIGADEMRSVRALATAAGASAEVITLAAFAVLAHRIDGTTDFVLDALISGRGEPAFHDTVGPVLNFFALRIPLDACTSFRDIVEQARQTCAEAYSHEIPIQHVEQALPELMRPYDDPMKSAFIAGFSEPLFGDAELRIGDSTFDLQRQLTSEPVSSEIPHGLAWNIETLTSGEASGIIQYNRDEFDETTVAGWAAEFCRILAAATAEPDRVWQEL